MALTGLQIFKLLPGTNCRDCGYTTCLAFAMKLAAGQVSLDKCPTASEDIKATLGAASAPPIRGVTIGKGERAITVGEETVYFRHDKTFVRPTGLFRMIDPNRLSDGEIEKHLDDWATIGIERAGELFRVDGIAMIEPAGSRERYARLAEAISRRGMPVALMASTIDGVRSAVEKIKDQRPLIVPSPGVDQSPFVALAAEFKLPLVITGKDLDDVAATAVDAAKHGVTDMLLEPPAKDARELHQNLSRLRRGALDRIHPGLGYPIFLRVAAGEFDKVVIGITKFASLVAMENAAGEAWLPYWTLRQNIYTDPQKPLQIDPSVHSIGEPDENAPLLVTTNFSLTYFIVSTELDGTGVPSRLAVVDAEGMSVLTAWSAGKFSGEKVAKELRRLGATEHVKHKTVIIPGYVSVISGELEDALGDGWRVLTGPQEASDLNAFFRDVWQPMMNG